MRILKDNLERKKQNILNRNNIEKYNQDWYQRIQDRIDMKVYDDIL